MSKEEQTEQEETHLEEPQEQKNELEELQQQLRRIAADYQNYRRRTEQQQEQMRKTAIKHLANDIIGVLDNFDLALRGVEKKERGQLYQGVELIFGQLITTLESHGVKRIEETEQFDANQHEAIMSEHSEHDKGTIIEILQHGYTIGERVLRTAKVKVSLGPQTEENQDE